jgi:hypothetical protein
MQLTNPITIISTIRSTNYSTVYNFIIFKPRFLCHHYAPQSDAFSTGSQPASQPLKQPHLSRSSSPGATSGTQSEASRSYRPTSHDRDGAGAVGSPARLPRTSPRPVPHDMAAIPPSPAGIVNKASPAFRFQPVDLHATQLSHLYDYLLRELTI